jgi:hypothetical protein
LSLRNINIHLTYFYTKQANFVAVNYGNNIKN